MHFTSPIDKATLITFTLFGTEALLHYNIGHNKDSKFEFIMPPIKDIIKLLGVVMLVSIINQYLVKKYTS